MERISTQDLIVQSSGNTGFRALIGRDFQVSRREEMYHWYLAGGYIPKVKLCRSALLTSVLKLPPIKYVWSAHYVRCETIIALTCVMGLVPPMANILFQREPLA